MRNPNARTWRAEDSPSYLEIHRERLPQPSTGNHPQEDQGCAHTAASPTADRSRRAPAKAPVQKEIPETHRDNGNEVRQIHIHSQPMDL